MISEQYVPLNFFKQLKKIQNKNPLNMITFIH